MKTYFVTYATDAINKYDLQFSVGSLAAALWDNSRSGVPMCVSHDLLRPIGWNRPAALYMEPGLARLVGYTFLAETDSERSKVDELLGAHLYERLVAEHEDDITELRRLLKPYLDGSESAVTTECASLHGVGLAKRTFPNIFAKEDKDGLVPLPDLKPIGAGVYQVGHLVLFAHHYFRRSLSRLNNLNYQFLERLQQIRDPRAAVRISLDPDMVGLASSYTRIPMEFEYWRGPKFNDDLPSIKPGVAHHEADERQRFYHQISGTQFWWHHKDGVHTLEAEEIRDAPTERHGEVTYGCRYVHARVASDTGAVNHFDGAIRGYTDEHMVERLDADIMRSGRNSVYTKLWRVDGDVPHALWKALLTDYYRDNPLVGEYLSGAQDGAEQAEEPTDKGGHSAKAARPRPVPAVRWSRERLVPFLMAAGGGVRLAVSFHPLRSQETKAAREVLAQGLIQEEGRTIPVVSDEVIELRKALQRRGGSLDVPTSPYWLLYGDLHIDLPPVYHSEDGLPGTLRATLDAIRSLTTAWNQQGHSERMMAFTVCFPIEDRDVALSVMGNMLDVESWLAGDTFSPPVDRKGFGEWLNGVAERLHVSFPEVTDRPELLDSLTSAGELRLNRRPVIEFPYKFKWSEANHALMYEAEMGSELAPLKEAMQAGIVKAAFCSIAGKLQCRRCHGLYASCECSKVLDAGVSVSVGDLKDRFLVWADETA